MMNNILFIDGKNTAYRALFATREFKNVHPFAAWVKFLNVWLEKFNPISCHVFWDCPKNDVWRKKLLNEYKDQRDGMVHYEYDVQDSLNKLLGAAYNMLPYMNIRQYIRNNQECDDLIYAACKLSNPGKADTKIVVISNDSDFAQLPWSMPYVSCYQPRNNQFIEMPEVDPVIQKALVGDKSDNIDGYRGIGPVKSKQLIEEPSKLLEFLNTVDIKKFKRNLALIDLSINPSLLNNMIYIMGVMADDVNYDSGKIYDLCVEHKVSGMISEFSRLGASFKKLK